MRRQTAYVGLDVHKETITMALIAGHSQSPEFTLKFANNIRELLKQLGKHDTKYTLKCSYEAGGCGFTIYRKLKEAGIDCMVAAPSLIPVANGGVKTDKRDAIKLARYLRAGLLTPVTVPSVELEEDRDLVRMRVAQVKEQTRAKQVIMAFLFRKGIKHPAPGDWTKKFLDFLGTVELSPKDRKFIDLQLSHFNYQRRMVDELENELLEISQTGLYKDMARILRGFRGIDTVTAMTIITHVPDFRAFAKPGQLMSYAGLTSSEYSSGNTSIRGGITKKGSFLLRKAFLTAAQQYSQPNKVGHKLRLKRQNLSASELALVEKADRRCRKRYYALISAGKNNNVVKTAIARELVGFVWEAMMLLHGGELREAQ